MRIWSIHPKYLDTKGLVALWREALLAKKVLENKTKGYKHHPQLIRFKNSENPLNCINQYLHQLWLESQNRNFNFDKSKISQNLFPCLIEVTSGQLDYERKHLLDKLSNRSFEKFLIFEKEMHWQIHPIFKEIKGEIEAWERN
ncbi:MAG: pyrimidine dimer DNA glycosylase/endonuclease V [Bacteroidota bacterium]|jgi:hypothetical protein